MLTKSEAVGRSVIHGIDTAEAGAHEAVDAGATRARSLTRAGTRWASRREAAATRNCQTAEARSIAARHRATVIRS